MVVPMALQPLPDAKDIRYPEQWPDEVAIVKTRGLKTWLEAFPDVVAACGIGAITGPPGTGKTTAACVGATLCGLSWGRVQIRRSVKVRELLRLVLKEGFELPAPDSWNEGRLQDELDKLLRGPARVVIVDDAHLLAFELLEFLRTSWTIGGNNCSLVLIGHQLDEVLDANDALDTRLEACVVFRPETATQALVSVRAMHPFLAGASDELIVRLHQDAPAAPAPLGHPAPEGAPGRSAQRRGGPHRDPLSHRPRDALNGGGLRPPLVRQHAGSRYASGREVRHLVVAPASLGSDRSILLRNDIRDGVLATIVRRSLTPGMLLSDLLARLGKDRLRAPLSTPTSRYEDDATTWLAAHKILHVVLLRADAAPDRTIEAVGSILDELGIELWLVVDRMAASRARARFLGGADEVAHAVCMERLGARAPAADGGRLASSEPQAAAELHRLRASGNRDAFVIGFDAAASIPAARRRTADLLASALRDSFAGFEDPVCLGAAARGAAVALQEYGWSLSLGLPVLAGVEAPLPPTRARGLTAAQINAFYDPLVAAALVLDALQVGLTEMTLVHRHAVAPDGSTVTVGAEAIEVPADLRPILRAQLAVPGARPTDALLGDPYAVSTHWLVSTIVAAYAEHNVLIVPDDLRDRPWRDRRWLLDRGITVKRASSSRRPARSITHDPEETARTIRSTLAGDWAEGRAGTRDCRCAARHVPPKPDELAPWPVAVHRAPTAFDTGIRRNAYRRRTEDFRKRFGS